MLMYGICRLVCRSHFVGHELIWSPTDWSPTWIALLLRKQEACSRIHFKCSRRCQGKNAVAPTRKLSNFTTTASSKQIPRNLCSSASLLHECVLHFYVHSSFLCGAQNAIHKIFSAQNEPRFKKRRSSSLLLLLLLLPVMIRCDFYWQLIFCMIFNKALWNRAKRSGKHCIKQCLILDWLVSGALCRFHQNDFSVYFESGNFRQNNKNKTIKKASAWYWCVWCVYVKLCCCSVRFTRLSPVCAAFCEP